MRQMKRAALLALLLLLVLPLPPGQTQTEISWPMAGANPQRTSWTPEEIRGRLSPQWAVNIEPFIPFANQIVAAYDTLYISTAKGLYALDAETGALRWVFPTEMPLGHSPTVADGVVYVGGYDHRLYALDAFTGQQLWAYEAGAGFATNPLVVEGKVILGNRDGYLYAVNTDGSLAWRFPTSGSILFSAAYKDGVVYFASNDAHAYAVHTDGTLKWKSAKLPGGGFYSYWPVIYTKDGHDYVVLGGSNDYRVNGEIATGPLMNLLDREALYEGIPEGELICYPDDTGTVSGDWVSGTVTIDDSRATEYLEQQPSRRRVFVLDAENGREHTFDSDGDGNPEYAPITWFGTHGGNRYPAVVGGDGVLYLGNSYVSIPWIPRGGPAGWKFGTEHISRVHEGTYGAVDEPMGVSAGGDLIYWAWLGGLRGAGAYDITIPYGEPDRLRVYGVNPDTSTVWLWGHCPGAGEQFGVGTMPNGRPEVYTAGGTFGIYCAHGNPNPLVPYKGKIYFHTMNTVFALSPGQSTCQVTSLPTYDANPVDIPTTKDELRQELVAEVQKMLDAGHLRPGYHQSGLGMGVLGLERNGYMLDYFHNPAETFVTLLDALPHLPVEMQTRVESYLQSEWEQYGDKVHVGWQDGTPREAYVIPPEIEAKMDDFGPRTSTEGSTWSYRYSLYGRWQYIRALGDQALVANVFDDIQGLEIVPPEDDPQSSEWMTAYYLPYIKNAFIAGYIGYIEIGRMAGVAEAELAPYVAELDRLLAERADEFSADEPEPGVRTNTLTVARNFMYMTPELADYLSDNTRDKVQDALDAYYRIAPYWFVSKYDATHNEGVLRPLYDYSALFHAKALIIQEPFDELVKWLDVPAFERGDLFYIQNLIAAIEAPWLFAKSAKPSSGYQSDTITYTLEFHGQGVPATLMDTLPAGVSEPVDLQVEGTDIRPQYDPDTHILEWSGTPTESQRIIIRYSITIVTGEPELLVNTAQLQNTGDGPRSASATVIANSRRVYLPIVIRGQ